MRMVQPAPGQGKPPPNILAPPAPCPNVEAYYIFEEMDHDLPRFNTTYFLSDIRPVLENASFYEDDVKATEGGLATLAWEVCSYMNGRDTSEAKEMALEPHLLPKPPVIGSTVVSNGGTPKPDWVQDYVEWYNIEHSRLLSLVPGWNNCRRYSHSKTYGEADIASFYGWNFYDAENGLGGPEWQRSMTDWTKKVRIQASKPNLRRVWKVIQTHQS